MNCSSQQFCINCLPQQSRHQMKLVHLQTMSKISQSLSNFRNSSPTKWQLLNRIWSGIRILHHLFLWGTQTLSRGNSDHPNSSQFDPVTEETVRNIPLNSPSTTCQLGAEHYIMLSIKCSIITITFFPWKSIKHENSYLIESHALNPSRGLVPSRFPPAMPATMVGSQSLTCMRSRLMVPLTVSGRRGLWMNPVTRIPPSHSVDLFPLRGQLLPPVSVAPPLSGRNNKIIVALIMICADYIHRKATMGLFTRERITFRKTFRNVIWPFPDLKAWFYPLWTQSCFKSGFWNVLLKREKGRFGSWSA